MEETPGPDQVHIPWRMRITEIVVSIITGCIIGASARYLVEILLRRTTLQLTE